MMQQSSQDQYFTPDPAAIHVGYECEVFIDAFNIEKQTWEKVIIPGGQSQLNKDRAAIDYYYLKLEQKQLRVPYLTVGRLNEEGWQLDFSRSVNPGVLLRKENYTLWIIGKLIWIRNDKEETMFKGNCKDINFFRTIYKSITDAESYF